MVEQKEHYGSSFPQHPRQTPDTGVRLGMFHRVTRSRIYLGLSPDQDSQVSRVSAQTVVSAVER